MRHLISIGSLIFGLMTLQEGGAVLFFDGQARQEAGAYIPWLVGFNFVTGFALVAVGLGVLFKKRWPSPLATTFAFLSLAVLTVFLIQVAGGDPYAKRTLIAMPLRTAIWMGIVLWLRKSRGVRSGLAMLALFVPLLSGAAVIEGVEFPDQVMVEGRLLVLNGVGLHRATVFRIKALLAGLYLEKKSIDAKAITSSSQAKRMALRFQVNVGGTRIADAWLSQMREECRASCGYLDAGAVQLRKIMAEFRASEGLDLTFLSERVEFVVQGKEIGRIVGGEFSSALLRVWLGEKSIGDDLKIGLLGG